MTFASEAQAVNDAVALEAMDYENDGDLDFASINRPFEKNGVTVFFNDGTGQFTSHLDCFRGFGTGTPFGATTGDFDLDGMPDLAVVTGHDSLFVLYGSGIVVGVAQDATAKTPAGVVLHQNVPNPMSRRATIRFDVPFRQHVRIAVYDVSGRRVEMLVDEPLDAGPHEAVFAPVGLSSGVYFYRVEMGAARTARRLILGR